MFENCRMLCKNSRKSHGVHPVSEIVWCFLHWKTSKGPGEMSFFAWHVSSFFLPFFVSWFVFARFLLDGFFQQKQDKYQYCTIVGFSYGNFIGPSLVQNKLQGIPPWMIMNFSCKICGPKLLQENFETKSKLNPSTSEIYFISWGLYRWCRCWCIRLRLRPPSHERCRSWRSRCVHSTGSHTDGFNGTALQHRQEMTPLHVVSEKNGWLVIWFLSWVDSFFVERSDWKVIGGASVYVFSVEF